MLQHISPISVVLLLGFASTALGTTCSSTVNSCLAYTDDVAMTCSTTSCTCTDTSSYSATDYGCADTDAIAQAQISAGVYSGEVETGQTISLTCYSSGFVETSTTVYAWYVGGTADAETSDTYVHTAPAAGTTDSVTCSISDSGLTSATSAAFSVIGVATSGGTFTLSPSLTGNPTTLIDGGSVDLTCSNIPIHTDIQFDIEDATSSTSAGADTQLTGATAGETYTCTLSDQGSTLVLPTPATSSVTVPSEDDAGNTNTAAAITITGYSSPLTINSAIDMAPVCGLTNTDTITYPTPSAYQWKDDGTNLGVASATSATLDTTELTAGTTYVLTCDLTVDGYTATSSSFTLTPSDTLIEAVSLQLRPSADVMLGNYMALRCIVTANDISSITYSWYFDDDLLTGHDDHTLQVYEVSSTHEGTYKCRATNGGFYMESADVNVSPTAVGTVKPTISSSNVYTRYGIGNWYTLTCAVSDDPEALALTYKWYADGTVISGETGSTYYFEATSTSVDYTCKATFDGTDTDESDPTAVEGFYVMYVALSGPSTPVDGASEVYTCTALMSNDAGTATYSIKVDGTQVVAASTYSISTVASSGDGAYTCEVTASSETQTSNTITVASAATPATPTVTVPSPLNTGGSYTLTCTSNSIGTDTTVTYAWSFDSTTQASETSSTYTFTATSAHAGTYGCTITINSQASAEGTATVTVGDSMGLICADTDYTTLCASDFDLYTGNCVSGYCECQTNVELKQNACGGVGAVAASILVVLAGLISAVFL